MNIENLKTFITLSELKNFTQTADRYFIVQSTVTNRIMELEKELGFDLFIRSNKGIVITRDGEEFLGYARQVAQQYNLLESRYIGKEVKEHFSVSMQHYSFAVKAFVEMVKKVGLERYEFAVHETKTYEVIENVRDSKSELGILYLNDFNRQILEKIFRDNHLKFEKLFDCDTYVYLWSGHPLAGAREISMKELEPYPCLAFDQGKNNSFYFAEEMMSTYDYKQIIRGNDRATMLNLMIGLNGYTLCSGVICDALNGDDALAIPLKESEKMEIGYIYRAGTNISTLGRLYLEELVNCAK